MTLPTLVGPIAEQVRASSTTDLTMLTSPWLLAMGADLLRIVSYLEGNSGYLRATPTYRFAAVKTTEPGAWQAGGTEMTGDGWQTDNFDLSTVTDQLWVQLALRANQNSASTDPTDEALASIQGSIQGAGEIVGQRIIDVTPTTDTNDRGYVPVGPILPAAGFSSMMFAVVFVHGATGVYFQPCYRTFDDDPDAPGAWSLLATQQGGVNDQSYNSGLLTPTIATTKMWWQPGLAFKTANGAGTLKVVVAAKYA